MTQTDAAFSGKIPENYENQMVPMIFEPYALDMADRVAKYSPKRILELAAGTGALTRELAVRIPDVEVVATDISPAMIEKAQHLIKRPNVTFGVADATNLPYPDGSFDVVTSQFGAMFFPERVTAFRHVHRVLRDGGAFLFSTWNEVFRNPVFKVICKTYKESSGGQACYLERLVFAYFDDNDIKKDLHAAGFDKVDVYKVAKTTKIHSAAAVLDALVMGSPLGGDFDALGRDRGAHVREEIFEALTTACGDGQFDNEMSALVVETKK